MFQITKQGICFKVKVIPKSSRSQIVGWEQDELKVRLAAVPEKGEANTELIRVLAEALEVGKSKVQLLSGETNRHKRVCVYDISLEEVEKKLNLDDTKR